MKLAFLSISLAFLVAGAQAAGTGFTFYRGKSCCYMSVNWNTSLTSTDHIDGEAVWSWESVKFEPGVLSKTTGCIDGKHGIKAVKVDYAWDITDRINCIRGYREKDCNDDVEDKELAFTFPWDSDVKGQLPTL